MQDDGEEDKELDHNLISTWSKLLVVVLNFLYVMLNFTCSTNDRPMFKKTFRQGVSVCITLWIEELCQTSWHLPNMICLTCPHCVFSYVPFREAPHRIAQKAFWALPVRGGLNTRMAYCVNCGTWKKCPRVPVWVRGGGAKAIWAMHKACATF